MDAFSTCFDFVSVAVNHKHVIRKKNAEKFLSTWLMISSCYFIYNARRDATAEKEFDIVIEMTLERVLAQRFKKKNGQRKSNF